MKTAQNSAEQAARHGGATRALRVFGAAAALAVLAACGSAGSAGGAPGSGASSGMHGPSGGGAQTVAVRSAVGIADVLTDRQGRTLYVSEQEGGGKVLCTSSDCLAIWMPLTVPNGQQPSGPAAVMTKLDTVKRPDGTTQVALDGKPLYSFKFDHDAGQVNGNGTKDSFGDTHFVWQVATTSGTAPQAPSATYNGGYGGRY